MYEKITDGKVLEAEYPTGLSKLTYSKAQERLGECELIKICVVDEECVIREDFVWMTALGWWCPAENPKFFNCSIFNYNQAKEKLGECYLNKIENEFIWINKNNFSVPSYGPNGELVAPFF